MNKSIKILISVILLIFGYIAVDCAYGFIFGGEFGWIAALFAVIFGSVCTLISIFIIFGKEKVQSNKARDAFVIIMILFVIVCLYGYKPLNRISGSNEYIEYPVEVVELYGSGKGDWLFLDPQWYVTVKDETGNVFEVGDYDVICEYDEGDTVLLREYTGGFDLKYYALLKLNK